MGVLHEIVKRTSVAADRVFSPPDGVTMLIYHQVGGDSGGAVDLDNSVFEQQLEYLTEHHRVLSLDAAVEELTGGVEEGWKQASCTDEADAPDGGATAKRAVVLTFDDGTADFTDNVVPALIRHGVPATLYAATQFIDDNEPFPWGAAPTSWPALAEALDSGLVTIGSHTHTHSLLDRLDAAAVDDDLDRSIQLIEDNLSVSPSHFAYPKALPGSPVAEVAVRKRFRTAALAGSRVNRPGHIDLHRLGRTPIQVSDDIDMFALKANGGMRLEGELRSAAARVRYRRADR